MGVAMIKLVAWRLAHRLFFGTLSNTKGGNMRFFKTIVIMALLCAGWLVCVTTLGMAEEAQKPAESKEALKGYDEWHVLLNPYGWLFGLQGDVTGRGRSASVDLTIDDTLKLLDEIELMFVGRLEWSKGPWGFLFDGVFVQMGDSAERGRDIQIPILVRPTIPLRGRISLISEISITEGALSYDVYTSSHLVDNMPDLIFEALAGPRYTFLRTKAHLTLQGPRRIFILDADKTRDWVDPFVGGRVQWRPAPNWMLGFRTDVGGFTLSSDVALQFNTEVAYRINRWLLLNAGYRALYTDYETGSGQERFAYNIWMHGPWMGVVLEF
jgi:hypothetical protein